MEEEPSRLEWRSSVNETVGRIRLRLARPAYLASEGYYPSLEWLR
jgi:hypothetical protein